MNTHKKENTPFQIIAKLIPIITIIGLTCLWITHQTNNTTLTRTVNPLIKIKSFEFHGCYLTLNFLTIIFPLLLSFDKKVNYVSKWKSLIQPIAIIATLFIIWDIFFTHQSIWGFNPPYLSGINLFKLPLGEWLFFFTVPFACLFIHECLKAYITIDPLQKLDRTISTALIIAISLFGLLNYTKLYTATTCLLTAMYLSYHYLTYTNFFRTRFFLTYIVSLIPFLLINGALTGSFTEEPIVIYNPEEFSGYRIFTIPVEDSIYSFLLLFSIIHLIEIKSKLIKG